MNTLPGLLVSGAAPDVDAAVRASVIASAEELTFVSLPPGTLREAFSVDIRNASRGTGPSRAFLIDGGFDPTGVPAAAGDRLELAFADRSGAVRVEIATVPLRRPPAIVRTSPTKGRTDVPLNVQPRVVFTEPVDPGTLGIELWHDDVLVGDLFVIVPGEPWAAEFQHELDLNPGTTYELRVTDRIRDLQGEPLQAPLTISFTTGGASLSAGGRIAFVSTRDGAPHIYVGDLDGSEPTRLAFGTSPDWSPDGEEIAFTTWPSGLPVSAVAPEVWRVNADGTNARRLAMGAYPSWSPDGRTIAFSRDRAIWVVASDGTRERLVTDEAALLASTGWSVTVEPNRPVWFPDGQRLVFVGGLLSGADGVLLAADIDGTDVQWIELEYGMGPVFSRASWAPDGSRFVVSTSGGMDPTPWITSALPHGRNVEIHAYGLGPDWSPDGRMLVYHRSPSQLQDLPTRIYVGDLTTSTYWLVPIIPPALNPVDPDYSDYDPVWSPARE